MATPKVGGLATLHYPSDSYPYIVVFVSANGYKMGLERLNPVPVAAGSRTPYDRPGDPANRTGIIDYAYRQANGRYCVAGSSPISFGAARYYQAPRSLGSAGELRAAALVHDIPVGAPGQGCGGRLRAMQTPRPSNELGPISP